MYLKNIRVHNFRNHTESIFDFGQRANILVGENGQGKTNILEAISYLCLTKSFYSHGDSHVVKIGNGIFEVEGVFNTERTGDQRIRVAYSDEQKEKIFTINKNHVEPLSSVIGKFPVVICSPEHAPITSQGPVERRRFIDLVISQSSNIYFQHLMEYRKILRNRNKVLADARSQRTDPTEILEPWNEQLINAGAYIVMRRQKFVDEFERYLSSSYQQLVNNGELPFIAYEPSLPIDKSVNQEEVKNVFSLELSRKKEREIQIGTTVVGPHRDELLFNINGLDLRRYASQGQHKTFLVALKIAEFFYLREQCNETPILLLDDIFSELDNMRAAKLLDFVGTISQTFITSTNKDLFEKNATDAENRKMFTINNGAVMEEQKYVA
ncbi:MAG: DNA replication/repair protein RecF [Ignavibacteriales bacterium]|nr:DNA replication/repair protein RecF [Ignavibacteriales bacterium]